MKGVSTVITTCVVFASGIYIGNQVYFKEDTQAIIRVCGDNIVLGEEK